MYPLVTKTSVDEIVSKIKTLNLKLQGLYDDVQASNTRVTSALDQSQAQLDDYTTVGNRLNSAEISGTSQNFSAASTRKDAVDSTINGSSGAAIENSMWISQFNAAVISANESLATITELANSSVNTLTSHAEEKVEDVHSGIFVLPNAYTDSSGNVVGRSTLLFTSGGIKWTAPADPNSSGPPKYPKWACTSGEELGRQNSYGETQPPVTWTSCAISGDARFKFIWQFRTVGSTTWRDFANVGEIVTTGHTKIHEVETTVLSTPYWKLGDGAWTTIRSSSITIKPKSRDEHGVQKIFDVRVLVVNEATVWSDEANMVPSYGYAESIPYGSMYSKDATDSFALATALNRQGLITYARKQAYFRPLRAYVRGPYQLNALKGYHWMVPHMLPIVRKFGLWDQAMSAWSAIERHCLGKRTLSTCAFELVLAVIGWLSGGNSCYRGIYDDYRKRF